MSVRLEVQREMAADPQTVWDILVDWRGQGRWVPLTTVAPVSAEEEGLGVRVEALSGVWLAGWPIGLLDRFVVTGWSPPTDGGAELEILHLGPYFTGEGVFRLTGGPGHTTVTCVELISPLGGAPVEWATRIALPVMRVGFRRSLRTLAALAER